MQLALQYPLFSIFMSLGSTNSQLKIFRKNCLCIEPVQMFFMLLFRKEYSLATIYIALY